MYLLKYFYIIPAVHQLFENVKKAMDSRNNISEIGI